MDETWVVSSTLLLYCTSSFLHGHAQDSCESCKFSDCCLYLILRFVYNSFFNIYFIYFLILCFYSGLLSGLWSKWDAWNFKIQIRKEIGLLQYILQCETMFFKALVQHYFFRGEILKFSVLELNFRKCEKHNKNVWTIIQEGCS